MALNNTFKIRNIYLL